MATTKTVLHQEENVNDDEMIGYERIFKLIITTDWTEENEEFVYKAIIDFCDYLKEQCRGLRAFPKW